MPAWNPLCCGAAAWVVAAATAGRGSCQGLAFNALLPSAAIAARTPDMMIASVLQRQGALLLGGRALSTSIAALAKREAADDFIFQEKCRGTRKVSQDSEDLRERYLVGLKARDQN